MCAAHSHYLAETAVWAHMSCTSCCTAHQAFWSLTQEERECSAHGHVHIHEAHPICTCVREICSSKQILRSVSCRFEIARMAVCADRQKSEKVKSRRCCDQPHNFQPFLVFQVFCEYHSPFCASKQPQCHILRCHTC